MRRWSSSVAVLSPDQRSGVDWALTLSTRQQNGSILLLTDVVARGDTLHSFLSAIAPLQITHVFALVDARKGKDQLIHFPFDALIAEPIDRFVQTPDSRFIKSAFRPSESEERIYVIDRISHAPILKSRSVQPYISFSDFCDKWLPQMNVLFSGHITHCGNHFDYFLDLPALFANLEKELGQWIANQLEIDAQLNTNTAKDHIHVCCLGVQGDFGWLDRVVSEHFPGVTTSYIDESELWSYVKAESILPNGRWVVILPAAASGATAQACIEYMSRQRPISIVLLTLISRMQPEQTSFFWQQSAYRGVPLFFSVFCEFPLAAHHTWSRTCNLCAGRDRLKDLLRETESVGQKGSTLATALTERIAALQHVPVARDENSGIVTNFRQTTSDVRRAKLRTLYLLREFDGVMGRQLKESLVSNDIDAEHFLSMIGIADITDPAFEPAEIDRRTYAAFETIQTLANRVLNGESVSTPIADLIWGVIAVAKREVAAHIGIMLQAAAQNERDFEEIGIATLMLQDGSEGLRRVAVELEKICASDKQKQLITDIRRVLSSRGDPSKAAKAVDACAQLWAKLDRSSLIKDQLNPLLAMPVDQQSGAVEIRQFVSNILSEWTDQFLPLISDIRAGGFEWLLADSDSQEASLVASITRAIARLVNLSKAANSRLKETSETEGSAIALQAKELKHRLQDLAAAVDQQFVNPLRCDFVRQADSMLTTSGIKLSVSVDVDYSIEEVFCDAKQLIFVANEMTLNWKKHCPENPLKAAVWLKLFKDTDFVVLEFGDFFGGRFQLSNSGGLGAAATLCRRYGGDLRLIEGIADGSKSVRIMLRQPRHRSGNGNDDSVGKAQ